MINIHPNVNPLQIMYGFQHISLNGRREKETFSFTKIAAAVDEVMTSVKESEPDLLKMEEDMLRNALETKFLKDVQAKDQANLRMNKSPEEQIWVQKRNDLYAGEQLKAENCLSQRVKYIYERDEKLFENDAERDEWQPRIDIIEQAFACRAVFSISIVPFNSDILQTWYDKKSLSQTAIIEANEQKITKILHYMPDTDKEFISETWKYNEKSSNVKAKLENPPEIFTGFCMPFPTFSSDLAAAQWDPENLPVTVKKTYVFSENELNSSLSDIGNVDLQDRIKNIIFSFIDDIHAKGMGLVILQAPLGKKLYFTKCKNEQI